MKILPSLSSIYQRIAGGWKTHSPGFKSGPGAFDMTDQELYPPVSSDLALKLSAWYAVLRLRAETLGTSPIMLLDNSNRVVKEHDLYGILRSSPNADMTGPEMLSAKIFNCDQFGYSCAIVRKWQDGGIKSIVPVPTDRVSVRLDDRDRFMYMIDGEEYGQDQIWIDKSFSQNGYFGVSLLNAAGMVLSAQTQGNDAAMRAFRNGLRIGGMFKLPKEAKAWTPDQYSDFESRMASFNQPNNVNKWMPLLPGLEPVAGQQFKVNPVDAELLSSRYFGIEEMCRFTGVPPPLIGHTDKASSWASSITALNQHLVTYSLQPTAIRMEHRMMKQLLTREDQRKLHIKFNFNGLLRGDTAARASWYNTMQTLGNLNQNEARALEDLPDIGPEGDIYRTQLNLSGNGQQENSDEA